MEIPDLKYKPRESKEAWENWRANCGPHSIAAACSLTLREVHLALPNFPGWMSPTMMKETLLWLKWTFKMENTAPKSRIDFVWKKQRNQARIIRPGGRRIARIQWEGKWLDPDQPPALAYRWTHWVALRDGYVLDTVICAVQWVEEKEWVERLNEFCKREGYGGWHFTNFLHLKKSTI